VVWLINVVLSCPSKSLTSHTSFWKPRAIAVIHCLGHTNQSDKISQGNGLADRTAKEAALLEEVQKEEATSVKVCFALPVLPDWPKYSLQEREQPIKQGLKKTQKAGSSPRRKGSQYQNRQPQAW
jgi:hypothetical protein